MNKNSTTPETTTKEKITNTAFELFAHQGYFNTPVSQIATKAGVSKSLIYNYFESKEQLLEHIIQNSISQNIGQLPVTQMEELQSMEQLMEYLRNIIDYLKRNPNYYRLLILLTLQGSVKQKIIRDLMEQKKRFFPILHKILKNKVDDPENMIYFIGALFDGLILHYLYLEEEYPLDQMHDFFMEQISTLLNLKSKKDV